MPDQWHKEGWAAGAEMAMAGAAVVEGWALVVGAGAWAAGGWA